MNPQGPSRTGASRLTEQSFAAMCDAALGRAYGLAGYLLGDATDAEDATQDAMDRAWRARGSLRDPEAFEGWLDRIVANVCRDRMRRRKHARIVDLEAGPEHEAADPFRAFLDRDELARALDALTPEQRIVVVLRFWRDLPLEQIAMRLDWPLGTVKSRLHHAMAAMRLRLERDARAELREVIQ
jgi:RNA polymerase sigma-70 factor (ECF subfamily)